MLLAALTALTGCGMPGAPQPPSLNLPGLVSNLSAVRTSDQVALTWKMPLRNTDKILLKGPIATRICRDQYSAARCNAVATLELNPGADATFTDTLPPGLTSGLPQPLSYFVELVNRKGRSAGLSNAAELPLPARRPTPLAASVLKSAKGVSCFAGRPHRLILNPPPSVLCARSSLRP